MKRYTFITLFVALSLLLSSAPAVNLMTSGIPASSSDLQTTVHNDRGSEKEWLQIVDPQRFDYGPEFFDEGKGRPYFDVEQFLLARSSNLVGELERELGSTDQSISEIFDDSCFEYGVSPKVLLTLTEMRVHLVDGKTSDITANLDNPFAAQNTAPHGFHNQLMWAADVLSKLYFHALEGYDLYPEFNMLTPPQHLDPANFALYSFAEFLGHDVAQYENRVEFAEQFIETYTKLFGDPRSHLSPAQRAMLPRAAQQVTLPSVLDIVPPLFSSPMWTYSNDDRLLAPFRDAETPPYTSIFRHPGVDIVNPHDSVYAAYVIGLFVWSKSAFFRPL